MYTYVGVLALEQGCLIELARGLSDFEDLFQSTVRGYMLFMGTRGAIVV